MTTFLLLLILLAPLFPQQEPGISSDGTPLAVISFKWSRVRRTIENPEAEGMVPARAMIAANKNFQRNVRANDPAGVRDPNEDTLDGRSAAMDKNVQESRSPRLRTVDGFLYRSKVRNVSSKTVNVLFWEYQITDPSDPNIVARRQFLCGVEIKSNKEKELEGFSVSGPSDVISVETLARGSTNQFQEKVVINRIEYADGSIWQRKDWNFGQVRLNYERILKEPWLPGMCKAL